jgi:hypothetical protein
MRTQTENLNQSLRSRPAGRSLRAFALLLWGALATSGCGVPPSESEALASPVPASVQEAETTVQNLLQSGGRGDANQPQCFCCEKSDSGKMTCWHVPCGSVCDVL